jgi:hypothetical protein
VNRKEFQSYQDAKTGSYCRGDGCSWQKSADDAGKQRQMSRQVIIKEQFV